ncbi:MAG: hypothetical protein HZB85_08005 [Deltaproteobacteria bacterium]|nr:hypothetical protein [Deltaproteobacteria bacterium]
MKRPDRRLRNLLLILPFITLIGCAGTVATRPEGAAIEKTRVLEIQPGVTAREKVIETFGAPNETTMEGITERLVYVFKEKMTKTYFEGLVESEVNAKTRTTTLTIVIKDNVVDEYNFKVVEK